MLKNKKMLKVILIMLAIVTVFTFIMSNCVQADTFLEPTINVTKPQNSDSISKGAGQLLAIFQIIGYAAAVVVLVWLGIKYITAAPDGKAEIKKQAFAYVLGAVLLFSAGTVAGIIKGFTTIS